MKLMQRLFFSKLRWNGFDLNGFEEKDSWRELRIPNCMTARSLKYFRIQIEQNNQEEYEMACQSYMNYDEETEIEEAIKNGDFNMNYDEEAEIEEALKNGDFNTNHLVMKRVAKEESPNISVMFKKTKRM